MSRFRKLTQTIWCCQYHFVWSTKYRFKILTGKVAQEVERCVRAFSEQQGCEIIEINNLYFKMLKVDSSKIKEVYLKVLDIED